MNDQAAGTFLLQDWTPLGQCLDVRLSRAWWAWHGADMFTEHRVPTLAHDSGALSQRSARVLFAWCQEQEAAGTLPASITLVEAGMGTGLHLRYLLDAFRDRCQAAANDWYDRLLAYGTDVNVTTVRRSVERGLYAGHAGHVRLGFMDVQQPGLFTELGTGVAVDLRGGIDVLIGNYVLDMMPVDVLRRQRDASGGTTWEAVLVRTWLRHPELLSAHTDLTAEQLVELAQQGDAPADEQLAAAYALMQVELRAWPVDLTNNTDLPQLAREADAQEQALCPDPAQRAEHPLLRDGTVVNHAAAALRAVLRAVASLSPNGYAQFRDIGITSAEDAAVARSYHRYGPIGAAGVNLLQIDRFVANGLAPDGVAAYAPTHDGARNHGTRLLARSALPLTVAEFQIAFDGDDLMRAAVLVEQARQEPQLPVAMEKLRQAVLLEPTNWFLLQQSARKALDDARQPDLALALAHKGLELNPEYSAELWLVYGDALYAKNERRAALQAYTNGLEVSPRHAHLHWSAAWVDLELARFSSAFRHLGEALASDQGGRLRPEILRLLDACLRGEALASRAEQERLAVRDQG